MKFPSTVSLRHVPYGELKYVPFDFGLSTDQELRAEGLHKKSIIFDCLQSSTFTDEYFQYVKDAGVTVVQKTISHVDPQTALEDIFNWNKKLKRNHKVAIGPVFDFEDLKRAKEQGKTAYIYGFQNTVAYGYGELNWVKVFYDLGIRIVQLTHNWRNMVADGCAEFSNVGLSEYGKRVVDELNRLKVIVDVSHVGDQSTKEAIERAEIVVASHSNARSVCDNKRNKTDEDIKAIAEKDGVIGMNSMPSACKYTKMDEGIRPDINDLLDHVDYVVKLVGADYVGIGFDLIDIWPAEKNAGSTNSAPQIYGTIYPMEGTTAGIWPYAEGIDSVVQFLNLTRGLVSRGYSDQEIKKILGLNWMRVFKRVL